MLKNGKPTDLLSNKLTRAESTHLFAPMQLPKIFCYTRVQLNMLRRRFFHLIAKKLFNLIKKAHPEHMMPETRQAMKDMTARFAPCHRTQTASLGCRVSFGTGNYRFNERILVDIMYLNRYPVLHIVDEGTHFSTVQFVPNMQTDTLWKKTLTYEQRSTPACLIAYSSTRAAILSSRSPN